MGSWDDYGGINAIFYYCSRDNWSDQIAGNWIDDVNIERSIDIAEPIKYTRKMCPEGEYVSKFEIQELGPQGTGDDTCTNGIGIYCQPLTSTSSSDLTNVWNKGLQGSWLETPWDSGWFVTQGGGIVQPWAGDGWADDCGLEKFNVRRSYVRNSRPNYWQDLDLNPNGDNLPSPLPDWN